MGAVAGVGYTRGTREAHGFLGFLPVKFSFCSSLFSSLKFQWPLYGRYGVGLQETNHRESLPSRGPETYIFGRRICSFWKENFK